MRSSWPRLLHADARRGRRRGELVAGICRDLGIEPDWTLWKDEDWAITQARIEARGDWAPPEPPDPCEEADGLGGGGCGLAGEPPEPPCAAGPAFSPPSRPPGPPSG